MNSRRLLTVSLLTGCVLAALLWLLIPAPPPPVAPAPASAPPPFDTSPGWIDMAYQPLAIPTGLMAEVMAHDTLLRQELAQRGLKLRLTPTANGEEVNRRAVAGKPEMAATGDLPALIAVTTREVRIVALAKMAFASLVARTAQPVKYLRGKRIANVTNSSSHLMLLNALSEADIPASDVTLVETPVKNMIEALDQGQVEAFAAWEPTPTQALTSHPEFAIIHRTMTYGYLMIDQGFSQREPRLSESLLASYLRSIQWMAASSDHLLQACRWNAASVQRFTGAPTGLDEERCAAIARRDLLEPAPTALIPDFLLESGGPIHGQYRFLREQELIPRETSWEKLLAGFAPTLARAISSQPERYKLRQFNYDK